MVEGEFGTMHDKESPHHSAYSCLHRLFHSGVLRRYSGNIPLVHCAVPSHELFLLLSTNSFPFPFFLHVTPRPL